MKVPFPTCSWAVAAVVTALAVPPAAAADEVRYRCDRGAQCSRSAQEGGASCHAQCSGGSCACVITGACEGGACAELAPPYELRKTAQEIGKAAPMAGRFLEILALAGKIQPGSVVDGAVGGHRAEEPRYRFQGDVTVDGDRLLVDLRLEGPKRPARTIRIEARDGGCEGTAEVSLPDGSVTKETW